MLLCFSQTIGKVYSLLGEMNAREMNDAMPTLPMYEFLEQFIPHFGNGLMEEHQNASDHVSRLDRLKLSHGLTFHRRTQ